MEIQQSISRSYAHELHQLIWNYAQKMQQPIRNYAHEIWARHMRCSNWYGAMHMRCSSWFGTMPMRCSNWFWRAMHMRCSNWGGAWHMRCSNRAHICHEYHELYCRGEIFLEILIKFLEILWNFENFWETLPQFTHVRCSNWFGAMHIGNCWFAGAMQMRCKS